MALPPEGKPLSPGTETNLFETAKRLGYLRIDAHSRFRFAAAS